ncbi:penicillin-binding protein [Paenibacillus albiflavus]|uniref:Penicillin-binding protein n=1 Tax=Paenibacillus albiflavus TaxID=2545760 RepID=A0A4R4EDC3_9BACL|nr:penicillin-binding transpeptidase domain-containing protein [Paenibacillus albiflavus]TCZ77203.1 penicillin-binding protein [Paenibacillus albiflavus]
MMITNPKKQVRFRMFITLLTLTTFIVSIMVRLFWIQIVANRNYSSYRVDLVRNSVIQRQKGVVLDTGRGQFYDQHMQLLTGELKSALVAFPITAEDNRVAEQAIKQLAVILKTSEAALAHWIRSNKQPSLWKGSKDQRMTEIDENQIEQINRMGWPYVQVVQVHDRYRDNLVASHLLGYIGQDPERIASQYKNQLDRGTLSLSSEIGGAGLEKTMQHWLRGDGSTSLSLFVNSRGQYIQGLGARTVGGDSRHYPLKVVTTIDMSAQQIVERLLKQSGITEGAVVVLDPVSSDIVAMASMPSFNPYQVEPEKRNWNNHAIQMAAPGSIYKTVIAAAALEEGVVKKDELFECTGSLGKYHFHCWKKDGHGLLTLEEAFADSCNIVFAKIAERLTDQQIEKYAKKLGLLSTVGWSGKVSGMKGIFEQLDLEDAGQLFAAGTMRSDEGVRIQTAIGQRDVRVTPLQAANLIVTLLHGGIVNQTRAVTEIQFQNDTHYVDFEPSMLVRRNEGISIRTSSKLLSWMREVVTSGTGQALRSAKWNLAGKTGTAETIVNGQERVNQWFIGYGPTESPKYAFAIVAENISPQAPNLVLPLTRKIMDAFADNAD